MIDMDKLTKKAETAQKMYMYIIEKCVDDIVQECFDIMKVNTYKKSYNVHMLTEAESKVYDDSTFDISEHNKAIVMKRILVCEKLLTEFVQSIDFDSEVDVWLTCNNVIEINVIVNGMVLIQKYTNEFSINE